MFTQPLAPPAEATPRTLTISGGTPRERGQARGQAASADIARAVAGYSALFTACQIPLQAQRDASEASLTALQAWDPAQVEELRGVAEAAAEAGAAFDGQPLELWHVGLVVARTEILTLAADPSAECSTVVYSAPGQTVGVQTWDWHAEFADLWHYQQVGAHTSSDAPDDAPSLAYAGFAEYGMLGKIGLNSAGVGVMLNILKNRDDAAGGVPVHAILAGVLNRARSVAEACAIIDSAHTTSSSIITVVGPDEAVMAEISPHRTSFLRSDTEVVALDGAPVTPGGPVQSPVRFPRGSSEGSGGYLIHTNHFIAVDQQEGALPLSGETNSVERIGLLSTRLHDHVAAAGAEDAVHPSTEQLQRLMCTGGDDAPVCKSPDLSLGFGEHAATLVSVAIAPNAGTIRMSPGSPADLFGTDGTGTSGPAAATSTGDPAAVASGTGASGPAVTEFQVRDIPA